MSTQHHNNVCPFCRETFDATGPKWIRRIEGWRVHKDCYPHAQRLLTNKAATLDAGTIVLKPEMERLHAAYEATRNPPKMRDTFRMVNRTCYLCGAPFTIEVYRPVMQCPLCRHCVSIEGPTGTVYFEEEEEAQRVITVLQLLGVVPDYKEVFLGPRKILQISS